ncbi:MAG: hypothetical protein HKP61_11660 [Dactylosporangium sp.]|nr:hypothetical protein [Dactylosporangium sp.]NNJ61580.1 hypothetical protein [Dactylosporangium sp.]
MSQPLVYDSSALIALFDAHPLAYDYWKRADIGKITLVFPALAIADANLPLRASYSAWSVLLWPPSIGVAPLDAGTAIEVGKHAEHDLATTHVIRETRAVRGIVLTSRPHLYAGAAVPVLVL